MLDKIPERQEKNKKIRRPKIVLWTVAIGAVIAITVIQVKKILNGEGENLQQPVAEAPKKVDAAAKKNNNRQIKQEGFSQSATQTFGTFVENPASVFLKEPETVEEACDALKYGDPAYYSVYSVLKVVMDSQKESPEDFSSVAFYSLGQIGAECDLDGDELMEVLRGGIEQGDVEVGDIFKDVIAEKCETEFQGSLDNRIIDGQREKSYRKKCQQLPDSPYMDCMNRDSVLGKKDQCNRAFGKDMKKCDDDNVSSSSSCWITALLESGECTDQATQECRGLFSESPRMDCQFGVDKEYRQKKSEWIKGCVVRTMQQLNIDPDEVKMLADVKKAKSFVELYEEMIYPPEYWIENEYHSLASFYIKDMQDLDLESPEILAALGVKSRQEFIDKYVRFFIDFVKRNLTNGERASEWAEIIKDTKAKFGL